MIARGSSSAFSERAETYRARVESRLESAIQDDDQVPGLLREAMAYSVLGGGKRIRPLLCYASAEMCGVAPEHVDTVAAALELVHAYSLVHDDLPAMDDDDLRRGRPTTHKQFDDATAILAGDALQALAFELLCTDPYLTRHPEAQARLTALFARAIGPSGMVGGQILDMLGEGRALSEAELESIHRRKTGQLIQAAIVMPGVLSELSDSGAEALDTFARDIGLVFQIRDDLLEIEQDTETLGKNAASDTDRDKSTYPTVLGPDQARARADGLYADALTALDKVVGDSEGLRWVADLILRRVY